MLVCTTDEIADRKIVSSLGLVQGTTIRARHVGVDIVASLRTIFGGEVAGYTKLMAGARAQALDRMVQQAQAMNANAIVGVRITTSTVMKGAAEIVCYGTAVTLEN